jgi:hypothetical protein
MLILILIAVGGMILSVQHDLVDVCLFKCVLIMESVVFRQVICYVGPPRLRCPNLQSKLWM